MPSHDEKVLQKRGTKEGNIESFFTASLKILAIICNASSSPSGDLCLCICKNNSFVFGSFLICGVSFFMADKNASFFDNSAVCLQI